MGWRGRVKRLGEPTTYRRMEMRQRRVWEGLGSCGHSSVAVIPKGWSHASPGWSDARNNGRRATLGDELGRGESPIGAALSTSSTTRATPLGFGHQSFSHPGFRDVRSPHVAPPWAIIGAPRWGWFVGVVSDNTPPAKRDNRDIRLTLQGF